MHDKRKVAKVKVPKVLGAVVLGGGLLISQTGCGGSSSKTCASGQTCTADAGTPDSGQDGADASTQSEDAGVIV